MLNLILAALWLGGAAAVWVYQARGGDYFYIDLLGQTTSVAWIMLAMGLFNLLRFGLWQARRNQRRALQEERQALEARRRRAERREPPEGGREPDPTFAFTDDPPPPRRPLDPPPSNNL
jgi:hypothetical protein